MDDDFRNELIAFIESLLKPDNLITRNVNGKILTGVEFLVLIEQQNKRLHSEQVTKVQAATVSYEDKDNLIDFNEYNEMSYEKCDNGEEIIAKDKILEFTDSQKCNANNTVKFY